MLYAVISSDTRHKRPIVIWVKETKEQRAASELDLVKKNKEDLLKKQRQKKRALEEDTLEWKELYALNMI
jgi:16S rRNA C1402 (ribose-2'-O) methylase RsmI